VEKLLKRFLRYISVNTQSNPDCAETPSSEGQWVLAKMLREELRELGINSELDERCYLWAKLDSNIEKDIPGIGFIAHLDTSPDFCGEDVRAQVIEKYDGQDIYLNKNKKLVLSTKDFPELKRYKGETIITSLGDTLLGADDKAGIAEIVTALEIVKSEKILHGDIYIAFTPDEEIGRGADFFDLSKFEAEYAYTIDGGEVGELQYENFNAAEATVLIRGINIHPGTAKGKMVNSLSIANEIVSSLPEYERPEFTSNKEGFFHLHDIRGNVEKTVFKILIRDFSGEEFEKKKVFLKHTIDLFQEKYPKAEIFLEINESYRNMKEIIEKNLSIVESAFQAMKKNDILPLIREIRGGTDGARLSYMGLPTPNIFTGGHNFHGNYEYISLQSMEKAVKTIKEIIQMTANG